MSLDKLRGLIEKNLKDIYISTLADSDLANYDEWIRTPALDLNRILGGSLYKGIPNKTLTLIVGPEHSFKSSFIALSLAQAQKEGFTPVIIDTEGGISNEFCRRWGLDTTNVLYFYEPKVDKIASIISQLDNSEERKLAIGIDSIGGIFRQKLLDDTLGDGMKQDQGALQKDIKAVLKLLVYLCKRRDSFAIAAGHFFGNPNSYGGADDIGGGKAAKLLPDTIISLKKSKMLDKTKTIIGNDITAITLKNRFYPPFQEATIQIDFKNGINSNAGLLDLMVEAGLLYTKGSWYRFPKRDGQEEGDALGNGEISSTGNLEQHPELLDKLDAWLKTVGYSTINIEVKELEEEKAKDEIESEKETEKKPSRKNKKSGDV